MSAKVRVDERVVMLGLAPNKDAAARLVMAGEIRIGDRVYDKPGELVAFDAALERRNKRSALVSKGAVKLDAAINAFGIDVSGAVCLDIGASTGGFTQVLLNFGAAHVYALDVGYGLLDARLRADNRVTVVERTNFRTLSDKEVPGPFDVITADVSFISLKAIITNAVKRLEQNGHLLFLIKPQFEALASEVESGGLVLNPEIHKRIVRELCEDFALQNVALYGLIPVPKVSTKKNVEYISWWHTKTSSAGSRIMDETARNAVVTKAFEL